jgi:hypothetical protein
MALTSSGAPGDGEYWFECSSESIASDAAARANSLAPISGQPCPRSKTPGSLANAVTSAHTCDAPCFSICARAVALRNRALEGGAGAASPPSPSAGGRASMARATARAVRAFRGARAAHDTPKRLGVGAGRESIRARCVVRNACCSQASSILFPNARNEFRKRVPSPVCSATRPGARPHSIEDASRDAHPPRADRDAVAS